MYFRANKSAALKILIIRFSSIGDIVLTFPVITAIKEHFPGAEIHYATKEAYESLLQGAPQLSKVHFLRDSFHDLKNEIKKESFDYVIDLHNNVRSRRLTFHTNTKSSRVHKLNFKKWLLTTFKWNKLPTKHIVDRYLETLRILNIKVEHAPLSNFHISQEYRDIIKSKFPQLAAEYLVLGIGAQFNTKKLPKEKWLAIIQQISIPMVLVGGKTDVACANWIMQNTTSSLINTCGEIDIMASAALVSNSKGIITHDTGMMHIAACFDVQIISIWGNTVPEFGMYPYRPQFGAHDQKFEVRDLNCRPCSKIGFSKCPKGHFKCMNDQPISEIIQAIRTN